MVFNSSWHTKESAGTHKVSTKPWLRNSRYFIWVFIIKHTQGSERLFLGFKLHYNFEIKIYFKKSFQLWLPRHFFIFFILCRKEFTSNKGWSLGFVRYPRKTLVAFFWPNIPHPENQAMHQCSKALTFDNLVQSLLF